MKPEDMTHQDILDAIYDVLVEEKIDCPMVDAQSYHELPEIVRKAVREGKYSRDAEWRKRTYCG